MKKILTALFTVLATLGAADAKTLVVYFSTTGTTENVAKNLATAINAPIYQIVPAVAYTDADLNWHDENSRTSLEMENKRPYPELADCSAKNAVLSLIRFTYCHEIKNAHTKWA